MGYGSYVTCHRCGSPVNVIFWTDQDTGLDKAALFCDWCGDKVQTPGWLRVEIAEEYDPEGFTPLHHH